MLFQRKSENLAALPQDCLAFNRCNSHRTAFWL